MQETTRRILSEGLLAGVIGFVTVAATFAVTNILMGRSPFFTAAILGATLYFGAADPSQVAVTPAHVFAYTGLHLTVFLLFGVLAAALATVADRGRQLWYVALFFLIFIGFHLFAAVQGLAAPMRSVLPDVEIWAAGIAASVAMGAYLLRVHPKIRARQLW